MWINLFKDYKKDEPLVKETRDLKQGCEMHESNGWGETFHKRKKKKKGWIRALVSLFGGKYG